MINRLYLIRCPNCGHDMKYHENLNSPQKQSDIGSKSKRCVFCGKSFKIQGHILKAL